MTDTSTIKKNTPQNPSMDAKRKEKKITELFDALREAEEYLSCEDVSIVEESLKLTGYKVRERERKSKEEQDALIAAEKAREEARRRELAAERARKRAERKHRRHVREVTAMDLPTDFVNNYAGDERFVENENTSASDGLMMSLDALGVVDIEFISAATGMEMKAVIDELRGSIYQNPLHWNECFYKGWETADEYLSGNLKHKLEIAQSENEKYLGYFSANIKALEEVITPDIPPEDIYVTLGSPWVPTQIIDSFIIHLLGEEPKDVDKYFSPEYAVRHDEITGIWEIPKKTRFRAAYHHGKYEEINYSVWGTRRMDMLYLMENILNMRTLSISDARDATSHVRLINREETIKILEKQEKMIAEFKNWVWKGSLRRETLQKAYNARYGNIKKRNYDGSFLEFPNMNPEVSLYGYQKNSVARILMSPNTLLAHDVGSGKTFVMIAAGMELRRLGKSKKNLYVVPNNIIMQWEKIFHHMYPDANILTVTNKNFNVHKRGGTLRRIKTEDFDAILMTYSCFDMLSLSQKYYIDLYTKRLEMLNKARQSFSSEGKISAKLKSAEDTLQKIRDSYVGNVCEVPFDELGINTLFLDEAHNYKNVEVETSISRVLGAGSSGSRKCTAMMDKVHCVQRQNNGGRVIFATGTPITNSITDIFVMQKYLQDGELAFLGLSNFDNWVAMFAEKKTDFEIDVDTSSYHLVTRFSRFCNIPELSSVLSSIADFHKTESGANDEIPKFDGYSDSLRNGSPEFKEYLQDISNRADDVRQKRVSRFEDNLLKITSDGRKAALDMRLIDSVFGLEPESKVMRCAENIMAVYEGSRSFRGVQLVFCDSSTPKESFNLYHELRKLLVAMGMKESEIAFVHDAPSDSAREAMFARLRSGELAVMIGSTFKMGIGVNVQKRLCALHHLDVPWRPADMVQREGRILRSGNENEQVKIFRYITKGSFDAYSWQMLEMKQRFISQILSGYTTMRTGSDVDETVLNYAEVKALAVGNPMIKRRVEVANELNKFRVLQQDYIESRHRKEIELKNLPEDIAHQAERIALCREDIATALADKTDYKSMGYKEQKDIRERIAAAVKVYIDHPLEFEIMTYRGFRLVVPAHMKPRTVTQDDSGKEVPYIYVKGKGSYILEIESESGITKRLNNFLTVHKRRKNDEEDSFGLGTVLSNMEERLTSLRMRETALKDELSQRGGFEEDIERLSKELDKIDGELGVKSA